MQKSILLIIGLLFSVGPLFLEAQSVKIEPVKTLTPPGGPTFSVEGNGLALSASFPAAAKNLDEIALTLVLVNQSNASVTLHCDSALAGFHFQLIDSSQQEASLTGLHKRLREGGLGVWVVKLDPGSAIVLTIPITRFYTLNSYGKYSLTADWKELKVGAVGWQPDNNSKLQLKGDVLLQTSSSGISISTAN